MNIRTEILAEHSKAQALRIAAYVGDSEERFAILMHLFLHDEYRVSQRAAWVVSSCSTAYPGLIAPYLKDMLDRLSEPIHDSVKRNTIRIFAHLPSIPDELMGQLADACFRFLCDPKEPPAIKVFSIKVLVRICKLHPELKLELREIIEEQLPYSTAAFRAAAREALRSTLF